MLQKAIKEQYPPLDLDVQLTRLAVPNLVGLTFSACWMWRSITWVAVRC